MPETTQDIQASKDREKVMLEALFSAASAKLELQPDQAKTLIAIRNALIQQVNDDDAVDFENPSENVKELFTDYITSEILGNGNATDTDAIAKLALTKIKALLADDQYRLLALANKAPSKELELDQHANQLTKLLNTDDMDPLLPKDSHNIFVHAPVDAQNLSTSVNQTLNESTGSLGVTGSTPTNANDAQHILIPVSSGNSHWRLVHIDKTENTENTINVFDSLGEEGAKIISDNVNEIKTINDFNDFKIVFRDMGSLLQHNEGYTCGDRVIIKAHHIVKNLGGECNETLAALATGNNQPNNIRTAIINAHKLYTQAKRMASSPAPELTDTDTDTDTSDTDTSDTESNASSNSSIKSTMRPTEDIKQVANDNAEKLKKIIKGLGDKAENTCANKFILNAKKIVTELDRGPSQQSTESPSALSNNDYTDSSILNHALNGYSLFTRNLVGNQKLHPQSESESESESESDVSETPHLTDPELAMKMQTEEIKKYINSFGSPSN